MQTPVTWVVAAAYNTIPPGVIITDDWRTAWYVLFSSVAFGSPVTAMRVDHAEIRWHKSSGFEFIYHNGEADCWVRRYEA